MRKITINDRQTVYSFKNDTTAIIVTHDDDAACAEILEEEYEKYFVQYVARDRTNEWRLVNTGHIRDDEGVKIYIESVKAILEDGKFGAISGIFDD